MTKWCGSRSCVAECARSRAESSRAQNTSPWRAQLSSPSLSFPCPSCLAFPSASQLSSSVQFCSVQQRDFHSLTHMLAKTNCEPSPVWRRSQRTSCPDRLDAWLCVWLRLELWFWPGLAVGRAKAGCAFCRATLFTRRFFSNEHFS